MVLLYENYLTENTFIVKKLFDILENHISENFWEGKKKMQRIW